ncbi:MAG: acetylglutamate kinase [Polyangiaceae bacterium]|nr:acetylglutamate kinase [Polyangiaceae bacterium]
MFDIGKSVATPLSAALMLAALGSCAGDPTATEPTRTDEGTAQAEIRAKVPAVGYHDEWRVLWEDHITWTRMVIVAIFNDLPGTDPYIARLLQNYEDMEDALLPYYDEEDVEEFGDLLLEHLTIAAAILVAVRDGEDATAAELIADWRENADALGAQMNEMNPSNWPLEETQAMWQEHLDVTLAEAIAHFNEDFTAEIAAWEQVHEGGLMMADLFSDGVVAQFKPSFKNPNCL